MLQGKTQREEVGSRGGVDGKYVGSCVGEIM